MELYRIIECADLLEATGIDTVVELAQRNPNGEGGFLLLAARSTFWDEGIVVGRHHRGVVAEVIQERVVRAKVVVEDQAEGVDRADTIVEKLVAAIWEVISVEDAHAPIGFIARPAVVSLEDDDGGCLRLGNDRLKDRDDALVDICDLVTVAVDCVNISTDLLAIGSENIGGVGRDDVGEDKLRSRQAGNLR